MNEYNWFDKFREHLFGMRKSAYEFGQGDRPEDHERMLTEQREIFAMIDALMLEYCPDEMSPEQRANWEQHQQPLEIPTLEEMRKLLTAPNDKVSAAALLQRAP